jgi:hypothetical protein
MKKTLIIPIVFFGFLANAQVHDFADTAVENAKIDKSIPTKITLTADIVSKIEGNNASHGVKIIVLLPQADIISYEAKTETGVLLGCTPMRHTDASQVPHSYGGYVICEGEAIQRQNVPPVAHPQGVRLKVVTALPPAGFSTNFSVMVYNLVPDSNMANNFWMGH